MKKPFFACVATLVVLGCLNVAASFISPRSSVFWDNPLMVMYPVTGFDPNVTLDRVNSNNSPTRLVRYVPDENRWYRLDPEPSIPEGRLVLNFGDSSTWGWGLERQNDAYSGDLQSGLPSDVTSVNLGVPGYTSAQGVRYLQELLPAVADRTVAVTLYFGNNDSTENGTSDNERIGRESWQMQTVLREIALYRLLRQAVPHGALSNTDPRVNPNDYEANMRTMIALSRSYGIPVVVIIPPVPITWQPAHLTALRSLAPNVTNVWSREELETAQGEHQRGIDLIEHGDDTGIAFLTESVEHDWVVPRAKQAWRQRLAKLAAIPGVQVVEASAVHPSAEYPYNFEDYCHPTPRLHSQIAQQISTALAQEI